MQNKKPIIAVIVFALVALIVAIVFQKLPLNPKSKKGVVVAANLPMSGPLATYGVAVREGATMALEELSTNDIAVDWQDNLGDPKATVSILRKQLPQKPAIYVSGVKPQTMAIKDEVSQLGLPHFVWIFDAYINRGSSNNLRCWVSYKIEPPLFLAYARQRKAKRVAISYVQLPHALEEFEKIVIPALRQEGITDILVEPFDFGRTEFKEIAVKIAAFKPDLIILNGFQDDLVGQVRSLRPLGAITDGNTIATYDLLDAAKILGPDELEGLRIVAPVFETQPGASNVAAWRTRFQAKYRRQPLYTHAFAYDMIVAIHEASKSVKLPGSPAEWLAALRAVNTQGVTGTIRFDDDGDLVTPLEIGVYRSGKLTPDTSKP
jgi:ABC-type branched-subunit amino acid transport system substrate-binding protein